MGISPQELTTLFIEARPLLGAESLLDRLEWLAKEPPETWLLLPPEHRDDRGTLCGSVSGLHAYMGST